LDTHSATWFHQGALSRCCAVAGGEKGYKLGGQARRITYTERTANNACGGMLRQILIAVAWGRSSAVDLKRDVGAVDN